MPQYRPFTRNDGTEVMVTLNRRGRRVHVIEAAEFPTVAGGSKRESICSKQPMAMPSDSDKENHWIPISALRADEDGWIVIDDSILGQLCEHCASRLDG